MKRLFDADVAKGSVVNGIAFALTVLVYQLCPPVTSFQWCVYGGFLLCVALGGNKKKYLNYLCSIIAGYIWAFFYWNLGGWFMAAGMPKIPALMLGEFICTIGLLYVHLHLLKNTWANVVPYCFLAVASIYATGGTQNTWKCGISVIAGMTLCIIYNIVMDKIYAMAKPAAEKTEAEKQESSKA